MSREELAASKKGASPSAAPIFDLSDPRAAPKADVTPVRPVGNGLRGGRIGDAFRKAYSKTANVVSSAAKDLYGMDLNQVRELPFTTTPQEVVSYVNQSQGGAISRSCGKNCGCSKCKKMALGKMKSGKGKNILIGRGLISTPSVKVSPSNIDFTQGIKAEPAYVPFGKHLINKWRLNDDVVMIRTPKGGAITSIPTQRVSRNLGKVLKTFVGGKLPDFESLNSLADEDKNILSKIVKTSKLNYSVPNPNKSKQEQEDMEFEILRGQIASGQDNKDALKKFKLLLVKMMNSGRIPKGQGFEILTELAVLGH
jgi:hypothetical protein